MKKLISLSLAILLVFSMAVTAFAEEETGSITIENIVTTNHANYSVYRILDLQTYKVTDKGGMYSYILNAKWADFFVNGAGKNYVTIANVENYTSSTTDFSTFFVTWKEGVSTDRYTTVQEFAKAALAYAKEKGIGPDSSTIKITSDTTVGIFDKLPLGYYLIDSDVGALCGLTTTNPDAKITAKNGVPTIDKQVKEDSNGHYGDSNTVGIGEEVNFMTTITVQAGPQGYVLHDKMTNMDFNGVSSIVVNGTKSLVAGTDYTETTTCVDPDCSYGAACTFQVTFKDTFIATLKSGDSIVVNYTATLTEKAVVGGAGNPNETYLEFGENKETTTDSTTTYTYGFDLVKTDSQNLLLDGASFRIYTAAEGGQEVAVTKVGKIDTNNDGTLDTDLYRHDHTAGAGGEKIVVTGGKVRIEGLDSGTFYLEEIDFPEGYNKLSARQAFTINNKNEDAHIQLKGETGLYEVTTGTGIQVVNNSGTILPETGAMGTTLFITFGMVVVLATGVLLVTKKRMSKIED